MCQKSSDTLLTGCRNCVIIYSVGWTTQLIIHHKKGIAVSYLELKIRLPMRAVDLESTLHRVCDSDHWDDCIVVDADGENDKRHSPAHEDFSDIRGY